MKNLRKIVAILAAVLMMISVLPMSAFAAPGDVVVNMNFDDGSVFSNASAENGYMVFDATTADWANVYLYANNIKSGNKYEITFDAKANKATNINVKINSNWGGDTFKWTTNVTTEWATYTTIINPDELKQLTATALLMFTSNTTAADGAIYHIDNVVVKEYTDPTTIGAVQNGDFETGDKSNWSGSATVVAEGYNGGYAAKLSNPGKWSEALIQTVPVEANTVYEITWMSKRVSGSGAFNLITCQTVSPWGSFATVAGQNWMNETSGNWVANTYTVNSGDNTAMLLKFTTEATDPGEILLDNIVVSKVKNASDDGFIKNGDFETGKANPWTLYSGTAVSADAAKDGDYGLYIKNPTGGWGGTAYQDFTVEVGKTYVVKMDAKAISKGQNIQIQNGGANKDSKWFTATEWTTLTFEFTADATNSRINICGGGTNSNEEIYVDNVLVFEKKDVSNDGFIVNGNFEAGVATPWTVYSGSNVSTDAAYTGNYGLICTNPTGGWGGTAFQDFSVEIGKSYEVTMWAKAISKGQNIQIQNGGVNAASTWFNKTEWTLLTFEFTATATNSRINISGGGTGAEEIVYFDDIQVKELKEPSYGEIINGDFETGEISPWDNLWGSCPTVEITEGMDGGYGLYIVSGKWNHVRQTNIAVESNTWYEVTAWAKNASDMTLLVKDGGDSKNLTIAGVNAGDEWTKFTAYFNSGEYTSVLVSLMGGENDEIADKFGTFDNISMKKHEHVYFDDCSAICEACGYEREVSHNVVHVEAVEPTCTAMGNIEYWYCDACGMAWLDADCMMNTNLRAVKLPMADHVYENCLDADCDVCGATREAGHVLTYTPAKDAIDCANPGNVEYWFCSGCNEYFANAEATEYINPWFIQITVDCVKPEGLADCASWTCETCGNENFGDGEHDTGVPACQTGTCSKCNAEIEGVGCQNYDTPACEDGECYYCGGFVAGFGHENGAFAPCVDGECAYGCGLTYPATEDHVDEDGDGYCDNCWNALPHDCIDEDGDGCCDICWEMMPVADVIYGDADGDGEITTGDVVTLQQFLAEWDDVEIDLAAADADGDGDITTGDVVILQQFLAEWDDIILGPIA